MDIYQTAWSLLRKRIEKKTGWGKEQLKHLMLECLEEATAIQKDTNK